MSGEEQLMRAMSAVSLDTMIDVDEESEIKVEEVEVGAEKEYSAGEKEKMEDQESKKENDAIPGRPVAPALPEINTYAKMCEMYTELLSFKGWEKIEKSFYFSWSDSHLSLSIAHALSEGRDTVNLPDVSFSFSGDEMPEGRYVESVAIKMAYEFINDWLSSVLEVPEETLKKIMADVDIYVEACVSEETSSETFVVKAIIFSIFRDAKAPRTPVKHHVQSEAEALQESQENQERLSMQLESEPQQQLHTSEQSPNP
jgi:hypothetical protein